MYFHAHIIHLRNIHNHFLGRIAIFIILIIYLRIQQMFQSFHQSAIADNIRNHKPVFFQIALNFLRIKRIRIMQTYIIQILILLFQRTHHIQNAVEIAVRAHILSYHFVAFLAVSPTFQIFGLIHPARNQYSRIRFLNTKLFAHNSPDILNDFHI